MSYVLKAMSRTLHFLTFKIQLKKKKHFKGDFFQFWGKNMYFSAIELLFARVQIYFNNEIF